ncbi:hypothetical protein JCM10207_003325 [Rhodosporidiobolus poonsookiae]
MTSQMGLYRSYGMLLAGALFPIWTGSHASLREKEEAEEDDDDEVERLSREDAYWFPIMGSVVLFSLFLAFKYLPKEWVNRILGGYMAVMAVLGVARSGVKIAKVAVGEARWKKLDKWKLQLTKNGVDEGHLSFTHLHMLALPLGAAVSFAQLWTNHWILSNLIALSFSYNAISLLYIDSFATGSILLMGLFVYDIWWVFGSKAVFGKGADVMVTVATSFDAPIKLLAPKDLAAPKDMSLLGLGDIVLPGIFIALALRFDYFLALKHSSTPFAPTSRFPKPYFLTCFLAYIAGLATTMWVMHTFRAAQPALLYLSPACILAVLGCAAVRGEVGELWKYVDGEEDEGKAVKEGGSEVKKDQ